MAFESAVADFSELETSTTCAGCGKKLNLLENHLLLTVKAQRKTVERVDARLVGAETNDDGEIIALAEVSDDEDENNERYYVGTRSGAADHVEVHNAACAVDFINKKSYLADTPKIKFLKNDDAERSSE